MLFCIIQLWCFLLLWLIKQNIEHLQVLHSDWFGIWPPVQITIFIMWHIISLRSLKLHYYHRFLGFFRIESGSRNMTMFITLRLKMRPLALHTIHRTTRHSTPQTEDLYQKRVLISVTAFCTILKINVIITWNNSPVLLYQHVTQGASGSFTARSSAMVLHALSYV